MTDLTSDKVTRPEIERLDVEEVLATLRDALYRRLASKGMSAYASSHEIDGVLDEEVREFKDAVHENYRSQQFRELMDIAVTCVFGGASLAAVYGRAAVYGGKGDGE